MNRILLCCVLAALASSALPAADDYVLTVNGTKKEIGLDRETVIVLPDTTVLRVTLKHKEVLRFSGELFSFEHRSEFKPNRNDLGEGVFQTMLITPLGSGILVQEYMKVNPTRLVDMMLAELTKEEVEYGYAYKEEPVSMTADGVPLSGKRAVTTHTTGEWTRAVLTYGGRDRGLLIVTFIEKDNYLKDQDLLDRFWKTLKVKR